MDENGIDYFYGVPFIQPGREADVTKSLDMLGPESFSETAKDNFKMRGTELKKIAGDEKDVKSSQISSMGMSGDCAFIVLKKPEEQEGEEQEDDPQALYYCWRDESGEWVHQVNTPSEDLPSTCLVSRYPIKEFSDDDYRIEELNKVWDQLISVGGEQGEETKLFSYNYISG